MGEESPEALVEEYAGKLALQENKLKALVENANNLTEIDDNVWNLIEEFLGDEDQKRKAVIEKLKFRIKEQNIVVQQLTEENEYLKEHMAKMAEAFERLKKLAEEQGLGKQIKQLVQESGLNRYLCRKVFTRLYEDAVNRIERQYERYKQMFDLQGREFKAVHDAAESTFKNDYCAFLSVQTAPTHTMEDFHNQSRTLHGKSPTRGGQGSPSSGRKLVQIEGHSVSPQRPNVRGVL